MEETKETIEEVPEVTEPKEVKDFKDLNISSIETIEELEKVLLEKINLDMLQVKEAICSWVSSHAGELTHQFVSVAPFGDYGKLMEDNDTMADFFRAELTKPANWNLIMLQPSQAYKNLLELIFESPAVDDGDTMRGYAYVSFTGKIRHAFACGE